MRSQAMRGSWVAVVLAVMAAWPAAAGAQTRRGAAPGSTGAAGAQADRERARALGEEGLEHFAAGRWQEAHDRFQEADRLFHAPTLVLYMARCQGKMGKPLAAKALYERVLAEPVPDGAPRPFVEAQESARTELAEVEGRIGRLSIVLRGGVAHVLLDGAPVPVGELADRPVEPGEHTIEAVADGLPPITRVVTVAEGGSETVEIAVPRPDAPAPPPPSRDEGGSILPALAAFGVGAAGVGVGTVTGLMTLSRASELKDQCDGNRCPARLASEGDRVDALATVSTIGFAVGGAGIAAGVVLLVLRPGGADSAESATAWRATVGPTRIDLEGRF